MSSPYRALLARPGTRPLLAASSLAWFSYSIYGLGFVLVVEHGTGSFATAGAVIAAFSAGSAALAPLRGRLVDRCGRSALLAFAAVHVVALLALIAAAESGASAGPLVVLGALGGASAPPLIAVARSEWSRAAGPSLAPIAHGLNAALSEFAQVIGPLLVAVAAGGAADPGPPVAVLLGGVLLAAVVLARAMPTSPAHPPDEAPGREASLRPPGGAGFLIVAGGELLLAIAFGALDIALPALTARDGSAADAAFPLAALAAASAAAALLSGTRATRVAPSSRFAAGLGLGAVGLALLAVLPELVPLAIACLPAGAGMGLAFAAVFELLDAVVDEHRAIEAFTWLTAAGGAGAAAGAALAGLSLAHGHVGHAMLVAPAAAGLAALLAVGGCSHVAGAARPTPREVVTSEPLRASSRS
ncbi:MAG: MFS transporter [Solirubrobacteraceae bacterium]|nr:MFS transporter [Solirubrobacteraceae bacterium]